MNNENDISEENQHIWEQFFELEAEEKRLEQQWKSNKTSTTNRDEFMAATARREEYYQQNKNVLSAGRLR